jgi:exonuclease III
MAELNKLNLTISSINVNSLNASTLHCANAKGFLKIEGVTGKKADIILISDCRMGGKQNVIEKMFNLTQNGSYKLYSNSTRESRGVAIAINREIIHEVVAEYRDALDENYLNLENENKKY